MTRLMLDCAASLADRLFTWTGSSSNAEGPLQDNRGTYLRPTGLALCLLVLSACGTPLPIDQQLCVKSAAVPVKTHFTTTKHQYLFKGHCHLARLRLDHPTGKPYVIPVDAPYTAVGYFEPRSGIATEIFTVPEPKISEPSRPYGTFRSSFRCEKDPWLYEGQCEFLDATANPPMSAYPPVPRYEASRILLTNIFNEIPRFKRPFTSVAVAYQGQRDAAVAKAWAAFRKSEQLTQGALRAPGTSYLASLVPTIRSPLPGQRFPSNTAIPIKLGSPQGMTIGGYLVRIERKGPAGTWAAHTTLPVGAAQAQSAVGYTGFGAGVPPGGMTSPGAWRVSAQVSAPQQSGWSAWVEFVVMTPAVLPGTSNHKLLQPPARSFGK